MNLKHVSVEKNNSIAIIKFDRKDTSNALSLNTMRELLHVARSFEDDSETRVVILTGNENCFSAGVDLSDPEIQNAVGLPLNKKRALAKLGANVCKAFEDIEAVTIAAINKMCIGGGCAIALACDFRIINSSGYFKLPELERAMNMSWQSIPRLVNLIGPAKTKQMLFFAENIEANQALKWGLANSVAKNNVMDLAMDWANKLTQKPANQLKMTKQSVNAVSNALNYATSYMDTDQFLLCQTDEDFGEAMMAFIEKRPPKFNQS